MSTKDSPEREPARLDGPAPRLLIIQAPYYAGVVGGMRTGAERVLAEVEGKVTTVDVAGAFELLTVDRLEQAEARSRDDRMNKGVEAAHALLGQIALKRRWAA